MRPGWLAELTPGGALVRASSADAPGTDSGLRVYSAGIVPTLDRIVTTTTDMVDDLPASRQLRVWRLSDPVLLHTITLPDGPAGNESMRTAEARVLADGRTVLASTFNCALYLMEGLDTDAPSGRLVASFPRKEGTCRAIPVVARDYFLVTVPAWSAASASTSAIPPTRARSAASRSAPTTCRTGSRSHRTSDGWSSPATAR